MRLVNSSTAGYDSEWLDGEYVVRTTGTTLLVGFRGQPQVIEVASRVLLAQQARSYLVQLRGYLYWPQADTVQLLRVGEYRKFDVRELELPSARDAQGFRTLLWSDPGTGVGSRGAAFIAREGTWIARSFGYTGQAVSAGLTIVAFDVGVAPGDTGGLNVVAPFNENRVGGQFGGFPSMTDPRYTWLNSDTSTLLWANFDRFFRKEFFAGSTELLRSPIVLGPGMLIGASAANHTGMFFLEVEEVADGWQP